MGNAARSVSTSDKEPKMSNGFAKVTLIGNLGKDPELKTTNSGTSVCNIRVACTKKKKDKDGNYKDHTEWVPVTCFGKTADNVNSYCSKGKQVYVEGDYQTREWQDKDGNKRYSTEVIAFQVLFLSGGTKKEGTSSSDEGSGPQKSANVSSGSPTSSNDEPPPITDDDIPF
jgi:single-strand DNA-binding protein